MVADGDAADVDDAVSAARAAFPAWAALEPADRGKYLFRIARILQKKARRLVFAITP